MSNKIPLAIVGCGGMGHRHMYGLKELQESGLSPFELVGACDPNIDNANSLADQAEERLGKRPHPVSSLEELAALGDVQAFMSAQNQHLPEEMRDAPCDAAATRCVCHQPGV